MGRYLGCVIVCNLLPGDYNDQRIEEIEETINSAISAAADGEKATKDNMAFSFPQDPSVTSATIPIIVNVELFSIVVEKKRSDMAEEIRRTLLSLSGEKRGNAIVTIRSLRHIANFAPKF